MKKIICIIAALLCVVALAGFSVIARPAAAPPAQSPEPTPDFAAMDDAALAEYYAQAPDAAAAGELWGRFIKAPGAFLAAVGGDAAQAVCSAIGSYPESADARSLTETALLGVYMDQTLSEEQLAAAVELAELVKEYYSEATGEKLLTGDTALVTGAELERLADGETAVLEAADAAALAEKLAGLKVSCNLYPPHLASYAVDNAYRLTFTYSDGARDEIFLSQETRGFARFTDTAAPNGDAGYITASDEAVYAEAEAFLEK
ncbi:MAG: hypothetical protein ACOX81_09360 [Candidatus Heteroscillospira sp.]|jgi:hypothetical protein